MKFEKTEISALKSLLEKPENRNSTILEKIFDKLSNDDRVDIYIDGAADLNSNTSGIGGVFFKLEENIFSFSEFYGDLTNNEAEYYALIKSLEYAIEMNLNYIRIFADSQLVVNQINGEYKVKHENMIPLHKKAAMLLREFKSWEINHIPRELNKKADTLSKAGMMKGRKS